MTTGLNRLALATLAIVAIALLYRISPNGETRSSGAISHEAYVWQRQWSEEVIESVAQNGPEFDSLTILAAEINWVEDSPTIYRVAPEYKTLEALNRTIGFAIRMGSYRGPFAQEGPISEMLQGLARSFIKEATKYSVPISEVQLDFDCPESKLDDYTIWVNSVKKAIHPINLGITALPSWLDHPQCKHLLKAADRVVLQVHSIDRPDSMNSKLMLCDPNNAKLAVEKMAEFGIPFRVALPTYTYLLAYDGEGTLSGLSAEGPQPNWPKSFQTRPLQADANLLTELVKDWKQDRPQSLQGLIWYRLPVSSDRYNWQWPTLRAVINGQNPTSRLEVHAVPSSKGLYDLFLTNNGTLDSQDNIAVEIAWQKQRLIASDSLSKFKVSSFTHKSVRLETPDEKGTLAPNESIPIGWIRLSDYDELDFQIKSNNP
jgi:hypothetical protein